MRFEFAVAAKYLVPRIKQLSTSIISLLSVLVISLVVWLILVFMSITDGLEKMWLDKLVSLNSPLRLTPTEKYFNSYYHKIDTVSDKSHFRAKTLQEKKDSPISNPYDEDFDPELPSYFPKPDLNDDGSFKDIVKETFSALQSVPVNGLVAEPFEAAMTQFNIHLTNSDNTLTNVTYLASLPGKNKRFTNILSNPSNDDLQNYLYSLALPDDDIFEQEVLKERFNTFFDQVTINELETGEEGWQLPWPLIPQNASLDGIAVFRNGQINRFIFAPSTASFLKELHDNGYEAERGTIVFDKEKISFNGKELPRTTPLMLAKGFHFEAKLAPASINHANSCEDLCFHIKGSLQNLTIDDEVPLSSGLHFSKAKISDSQDLWLNKSNLYLPDDGVIVPKAFKESGVLLGDKGYLSYQAPTGSSVQEMHTPIFVAGFYDPGVMSVGGKLLIVKPEIATLIRSTNGTQNQPLGTGIQVWFDDLNQAQEAKAHLVKELQKRNLSSFWHVETFHEYDFAKDLVQQLKSDKNLFSLLAIIIILVACSNIISMLILLVNDKRKEIGILQSMGASSASIALIFGTCGVIMGVLSSLVGTFVAYLTLSNIQYLVNFLSALQGFDAFNVMFYGDSLPNQMSASALTMVWIATSIISLLAGLIPAIKASLMKPTAILRSE